MLHMNAQKQYNYSETCSQANLVNVSIIMSKKKNLPTLLNTSFAVLIVCVSYEQSTLTSILKSFQHGEAIILNKLVK